MTWDEYFHNLCCAVAGKSPCKSRQIGAILVKNKRVISTGYNGPAMGIPHCGEQRFMVDPMLTVDTLKLTEMPVREVNVSVSLTCPRKLAGYASGEGLHMCPAIHAEVNAVIMADPERRQGSTLYMNSVIPCINCFSVLINGGVAEIVVEKLDNYSPHAQYIVNSSRIKLRTFDHL